MVGWALRLLIFILVAGGLVLFHSSRRQREPRTVTAAREKVLLIGNRTEIETLDPHMATGVPEHKVISAIFDGLVGPGDEDPEADAPAAAESVEHENFTRWTFKLRKNGRWSDGVPVKADDFLFAFQRILTPEIASDYGPMLYCLLNAEAYHRGEIKDFSQVGAKALDDYTLQLQLKGPTPYLPGMLKHYTWFPIPKHVVLRHGTITDRLNPWTQPENIVSNGPFKLKEWRFTHYLAVERNPFYWDAKSVRLREIHFFPISSEATEERAFQAQQLHLTDKVPMARIPYYQEKKDTSFHSYRTLGVQFVRMNMTRAPMKDLRVRQALSLALDRQSMVTNVLRAGEMPAHGLTPPGCAKGFETPAMITRDIAEARRLLAEAGYPGGKGFPKIEMVINQTNTARALGEAMQEMWRKELGIQVSLLNQEWQVYLDKMRKLDYDLVLAGWVGDYPDPSTFLTMWKTGDGNNMTGFSNADYDAMISKSEVTAELTERMTVLQNAERLLLTQLPMTPVYWRVESYLASPQVKNLRTSMLEHRSYKVIDLE